MTADRPIQDEAAEVPVASITTRNAPSATLWRAIDGWFARMGDRLNPILVKESRQALKSKQFVVTFSLVLICAWAWSLLGIALLSPGVRYAPGGGFMLSGYFTVLVVPVLLIVPFSAFRSLAIEREDGTFELLSITSLSAWQIVTGKLGSAVMQMLVYFSALAPCIAFTYMLRGVDIVSIAFLLGYTFVGSVLLSAFGLAVGTVSRVRHWQSVLSVFLLLFLLIVTFYWCGAFLALVTSGQVNAFDDVNFWLAQLSIVSFCLSYMVLFVVISAAQISFLSDNRSTRIRLVLLLQHFMWIGWMIFFWLRWDDDDVPYVAVIVAGIHWTLVGALMTGEQGVLSERVKRSLPQSVLGRMAFTWLNPGPGTGYVFTVANLVVLSVTFVVVADVATSLGYNGFVGNGRWKALLLLIPAYITIYLGIGHMLIRMVRHVGRVTMFLALAVNALVLLAGIAVPIFTVAKLRGYNNLEYGFSQVTNWAWTLHETVEGRIGIHADVLFAVTIAAIVVFLLNLWFESAETRHLRAAAPARVVDDDIALHPEKAPKPSGPQSPWDDENVA